MPGVAEDLGGGLHISANNQEAWIRIKDDTGFSVLSGSALTIGRERSVALVDPNGWGWGINSAELAKHGNLRLGLTAGGDGASLFIYNTFGKQVATLQSS
jgi:hypothetical protein